MLSLQFIYSFDENDKIVTIQNSSTNKCTQKIGEKKLQMVFKANSFMPNFDNCLQFQRNCSDIS